MVTVRSYSLMISIVAWIIWTGTRAPIIMQMVVMTVVGGNMVVVGVRTMMLLVLGVVVVGMGARGGLVRLIAKHGVFPSKLFELVLSHIGALF
jgi:hypothetical protein